MGAVDQWYTDEKYGTDLVLARSSRYDFADGNDVIKFGFMDNIYRHTTTGWLLC